MAPLFPVEHEITTPNSDDYLGLFLGKGRVVKGDLGCD